MFTVIKEIYDGRISRDELDQISEFPIETIGYMYYPYTVHINGGLEINYHPGGMVGFMNSFAPTVKLTIMHEGNNYILKLIMNPKRMVVLGISIWGVCLIVLGLVVLAINLKEYGEISMIHFSPFALAAIGVFGSIIEYYFSVRYYYRVFKSSIYGLLHDH